MATATMDARAQPGTPSLSDAYVNEQIAGMEARNSPPWRDEPEMAGYSSRRRWFIGNLPGWMPGGKRIGTKYRHHLINGSRSWDRRPLKNIFNQLLLSVRSNPDYDDRTKAEMEYDLKALFLNDQLARAGAVRHSWAAKQHIESLRTGLGHQLEGPFDYRLFTFDLNVLYSGFDEQMMEVVGNITNLVRRTFDIANRTHETKTRGALLGIDHAESRIQRLNLSGIPGYFGGTPGAPGTPPQAADFSKIWEDNVRLGTQRISREVANTIGFLDGKARACKVFNPVLNNWMRYPNLHTAQRADAGCWDRNPEARLRYAEELVYDQRYLGAALQQIPVVREVDGEAVPVYLKKDPKDPTKNVEAKPEDPGSWPLMRNVITEDVEDMRDRILRAQQLMGGGPSGMEAARRAMDTLMQEWYTASAQITPPQEELTDEQQDVVDKINKIFEMKQQEMVVCLEAEAMKRQHNLDGKLKPELVNNNPWYERSTYARIFKRTVIIGAVAKLAAAAITTTFSVAGVTGGVSGWFGATVANFVSTSAIAGGAKGFLAGAAAAGLGTTGVFVVAGAAVALGATLIARNLWKRRQWNRLGAQIARNRNSARDIDISDAADPHDPWWTSPTGGGGGPSGGGGGPRKNSNPPGPIGPIGFGWKDMFIKPKTHRRPGSGDHRYDIYNKSSDLPRDYEDGLGSDPSLPSAVTSGKKVAAEVDAFAREIVAEMNGVDVKDSSESLPTVALVDREGSFTGNVVSMKEFRDRKEAAARANNDSNPISPTVERKQSAKQQPQAKTNIPRSAA